MSLASGLDAFGLPLLYNFFYMTAEGGGGQSLNFYVTLPGGSEQRMNLDNANGQVDMWKVVSSSAGSEDIYSIIAQKGPQSFSAEGLPAGLSLNPATGVISGATTAIGDYNVTLTAHNLSGSSVPQTLSLNVLPNVPVIREINSSNIGGTSAVIDFRLVDTGGEDPQVSLFYGLSDGNQTIGDWDANRSAGNLSVGTHSIPLTGLSTGTLYFVRILAANSAGSAWTFPFCRRVAW